MRRNRTFKPSELSKTVRQGFTLIELLVVITIIVVLLAMLLPAMDKAIEASLRAVCATRLRGFGVAITHYSMDHKRKLLRVVSFHSQNANAIYPSVARNLDSQGPGQWSGQTMAPYIGGVDLGLAVEGQSIGTGGVYGEQWYCPSNGKTSAKDEGNKLSSLAPGSGSPNNAGWMALDYAYFARVPALHATNPQQLVNQQLVSGRLLMADTLYYWQGGGHNNWWFNHHADGPSVHDVQWGTPTLYGEAVRGLSGTNQLFGDVAVIWKEGSKFDAESMWQPNAEKAGFVSGGPGPQLNHDLNFY